MPKCADCGYVYGHFVQNYCPRCHLKEMAYGMTNAFLKQRVSVRWGQILREKDVYQGPFGICGMASALHVLLTQRPHRASDLAAATFWDLWQNDAVISGHPGLKEFQTAKSGGHHIDLPYLLRRHAQMWHHPDPKVGPPDQAHFTDYCVSRALGYLLKVTEPDRYDSEKCDFNRFLAEPQTGAGRKVKTRSGTLALRTDTVAYILRDLLGAEVEIAHNVGSFEQPHHFWLKDVTRKKINTAPQMIDGIQRELGQGKFVIAAIDATLILPGVLEAVPPASLPYNHWVVIEGATRTMPNNNNLNIWSWGNADDYPGQTDDQVMHSIYSLIVGRFWSPAAAA